MIIIYNYLQTRVSKINFAYKTFKVLHIDRGNPWLSKDFDFTILMRWKWAVFSAERNIILLNCPKGLLKGMMGGVLGMKFCLKGYKKMF